MSAEATPEAGTGTVPAPAYDGIDALLAKARSRYERVTPQQAYAELTEGDGLLVDTRPEWQRGAEGEVAARLRPLLVERNHLEWRFDPRQDARLPQAAFGARVIVLCQEGYSSSLAADALRSIGVHRATDVIGGFEAWREAGLPSA